IEQAEAVELLLAGEQTALAERVALMKINIPSHHFVFGQPVANDEHVLHFDHFALCHRIDKFDLLSRLPFKRRLDTGLSETPIPVSGFQSLPVLIQERDREWLSR